MELATDTSELATPSTPRPPLATPYWLVEPAPSMAVLLARRTACRYANEDEVRWSLQALVGYLDSYARPHWSMLLDFRAYGPGRNDESFERTTRPLRARVVQDFLRVAVLVRTSAGYMQLARMRREDGGSYRVYRDAEAARAYVLQSAMLAS